MMILKMMLMGSRTPAVIMAPNRATTQTTSPIRNPRVAAAMLLRLNRTASMIIQATKIGVWCCFTSSNSPVAKVYTIQIMKMPDITALKDIKKRVMA